MRLSDRLGLKRGRVLVEFSLVGLVRLGWFGDGWVVLILG